MAVNRKYFFAWILVCSLAVENRTARADEAGQSEFANLLSKRDGYQLMAKVMKAKLIQDALEANESVTVLAVPDKTLADVSAKFGERVLFAFEHLIVPGRFNTDSISKNSGKWLLPMGSRSPTSGWRLKPHPNPR